MKVARRSSSDRQTELVDAALRIIEKKGISALSTRQLADEVGLTTGAIFRHFATLKQLLEAVVTRVESVLDATYPSLDLSAEDRLCAFIQARSTAVGQQIGILRLVTSEQFLLALPRRDSERLSACVQRTRKYIIQCIEEAQVGGVFRDDISASALTVIVLGTIHILALSTLGPSGIAPQAQEARDGLFLLLRTPQNNQERAERS